MRSGPTCGLSSSEASKVRMRGFAPERSIWSCSRQPESGARIWAADWMMAASAWGSRPLVVVSECRVVKSTSPASPSSREPARKLTASWST